MKYTALLFGLLLIPSISSAAPLTNDQANSLIAVVQYEYKAKLEGASGTFDITVQDMAGNKVTKTLVVQ